MAIWFLRPFVSVPDWAVDIMSLLRDNIERMKTMALQLEKLETEIMELESVGEGVVTLLASLSAEIRDLRDSPAKLDALANRVDAMNTRFGVAVAAGTAAAGEPAPAEPEPEEEEEAE